MPLNSSLGFKRMAGRCLVMFGRCAGWRRRPARQLRLCETLSLGERRFVAVVQFEQQRFLLGGTGNSIALLACLPAADAVEVPECNVS